MAATESLSLTYWVLDAICAGKEAQPAPRKRRGHRCNVSGPLTESRARSRGLPEGEKRHSPAPLAASFVLDS